MHRHLPVSWFHQNGLQLSQAMSQTDKSRTGTHQHTYSATLTKPKNPQTTSCTVQACKMLCVRRHANRSGTASIVLLCHGSNASLCSQRRDAFARSGQCSCREITKTLAWRSASPMSNPSPEVRIAKVLTLGDHEGTHCMHRPATNEKS